MVTLSTFVFLIRSIFSSVTVPFLTMTSFIVYLLVISFRVPACTIPQIINFGNRRYNIFGQIRCQIVSDEHSKIFHPSLPDDYPFRIIMCHRIVHMSMKGTCSPYLLHYLPMPPLYTYRVQHPVASCNPQAALPRDWLLLQF